LFEGRIRDNAAGLSRTEYVESVVLDQDYDSHTWAQSFFSDGLAYLGYLEYLHLGLEGTVSVEAYVSCLFDFQLLYRNASKSGTNSYHNATHAVYPEEYQSGHDIQIEVSALRGRTQAELAGASQVLERAGSPEQPEPAWRVADAKQTVARNSALLSAYTECDMDAGYAGITEPVLHAVSASRLRQAVVRCVREELVASQPSNPCFRHDPSLSDEDNAYRAELRRAHLFGNVTVIGELARAGHLTSRNVLVNCVTPLLFKYILVFVLRHRGDWQGVRDIGQMGMFLSMMGDARAGATPREREARVLSLPNPFNRVVYLQSLLEVLGPDICGLGVSEEGGCNMDYVPIEAVVSLLRSTGYLLLRHKDSVLFPDISESFLVGDLLDLVVSILRGMAKGDRQHPPRVTFLLEDLLTLHDRAYRVPREAKKPRTPRTPRAKGKGREKGRGGSCDENRGTKARTKGRGSPLANKGTTHLMPAYKPPTPAEYDHILSEAREGGLVHALCSGVTKGGESGDWAEADTLLLAEALPHFDHWDQYVSGILLHAVGCASGSAPSTASLRPVLDGIVPLRTAAGTLWPDIEAFLFTSLCTPEAQTRVLKGGSLLPSLLGHGFRTGCLSPSACVSLFLGAGTGAGWAIFAESLRYSVEGEASPKSAAESALTAFESCRPPLRPSSLLSLHTLCAPQGVAPPTYGSMLVDLASRGVCGDCLSGWVALGVMGKVFTERDASPIGVATAVRTHFPVSASASVYAVPVAAELLRHVLMCGDTSTIGGYLRLQGVADILRPLPVSSTLSVLYKAWRAQGMPPNLLSLLRLLEGGVCARECLHTELDTLFSQRVGPGKHLRSVPGIREYVKGLSQPIESET
ncbi:hypothetical protein KIPB_007634, partial [Kipferlia bialata]